MIRDSRRPRRAYCAECSEPVALVAVDQAMKISGLSSRAIYRLIEQGRIHLYETPEGLVLVCPVTLLGHVGGIAKGKYHE